MKYKTVASCAEEHVMEMLKSEKNIMRPWSLVNHSMTGRTLQTTASEIPLLFNNHAQVRPGFESNDETVYIPNLFVKISGVDPELQEFYDAESLQKRELCLLYPSLSDFNTLVEEYPEDAGDYLDENGMIDRERLLNSGSFPYSFLRIEYQDILIGKMNEVILNRHVYFTGAAAADAPALILSHFLRIEERIMAAFNAFDFPFLPPAAVIHSCGSETMSSRQAHILMLMNLLGFDIIIVSRQGFSNIENLIKTEHYNLYYGDSLQTALPARKPGKQRRLSAVAGIAAAVTALAVAAVVYISGLPENTGTEEWDKSPAVVVKSDEGITGISMIDNRGDNIPVTEGISISGRVTDYLGNPVLNAEVEVYQVKSIAAGVPSYGSENYWNIPGWDRIRTTTDSDGMFVIENFSDFKENSLHAYVIEFYMPWELQYEGRMLQNPEPLLIDMGEHEGGTMQTGDMIAKHGGSVIAEVQDENGSPYTRDINIDLRRSNDQKGFPITTYGHEEGLHYSVGLPDGRYYLDIAADGYKSERISGIVVETGKVEKLVVKLTKS